MKIEIKIKRIEEKLKKLKRHKGEIDILSIDGVGIESERSRQRSKLEKELEELKKQKGDGE